VGGGKRAICEGFNSIFSGRTNKKVGALERDFVDRARKTVNIGA
jgi:hypothetical protein